MERSIDDRKDTTEQISETGSSGTAKIFAMNGERIDSAAWQDRSGQTPEIIAFDTPGDSAEAPAEEALPDNADGALPGQPEQQAFEKSNDFFDEVPHRVIGVISSKEIEEAEDYDIFEEAEQMSDGDEPAPEKDETVRGLFKQIFGSIKRFFVHLSYFFTNVKRRLQQKRTAGKRKKAEEERRRRAAERRLQRQEEMESRRGSNGLVQVRRRRERRDNDSR